MKTIKILFASLGLGALVVLAMTSRSSASQEFATVDGDLAPVLSADLPADAKGCMQWKDADSPDVLTDPRARARVTAESLAWIKRVIHPELVPESPVFKPAAIGIAPQEGKGPVVYDGTRMKSRVRTGELFMTQTAGKLCVVYRPNAGEPGAKDNSPQELRRYLESTVKRLFKDAPAMLVTSREEPFRGGFSLGLDLERTLQPAYRLAEEVHALAPDLPYPPVGGLHSYYFGSYFFCTDGRDVVATFNKVLGGAVISIDRPRW